MHEPDQRPGLKVTGLLQIGLFAAAASAVVAAGGVSELIPASHRNVSRGLIRLAGSLYGFSIAGRLWWTYRRQQQGRGPPAADWTILPCWTTVTGHIGCGRTT